MANCFVIVPSDLYSVTKKGTIVPAGLNGYRMSYKVIIRLIKSKEYH